MRERTIIQLPSLVSSVPQTQDRLALSHDYFSVLFHLIENNSEDLATTEALKCMATLVQQTEQPFLNGPELEEVSQKLLMQVSASLEKKEKLVEQEEDEDEVAKNEM